MKKALSIILAALMLSASFALTACSGGNGDETTPETTGETTGETTADTEAETTPETEAETTAPETEAETAAPETEAETEAPAPAESNEGTIFDQMSEWHYTTFVCPYTDGEGVVGGGAANGHFEEADDEMAAFIKENPEWYKDTALMEKWDVVEAPFGDCINSMLAAQTDFVLDPTNTNGLMTYKTFTIDDLGDDMYYTMNCFYDNTVYIYVNGEAYYIADANCGSGDWNGGYDEIKCNTAENKTLKDFLHEGENYVAVSIKNCWGGREFDMYISYEKNATKKTMSFFKRGSDWHYTVFACPYTDGEGTVDGSVSGGYYDEATDDMAKFIKENPNFMTDTATLSTWPTANGPFGNIMEDIGWTGSNHGLILYKTFTVDDLATAKQCDDFVWDSAYDNAIHVYLNGTEVYTDDGECVATDWQDGLFNLDKAQISDVLKEGENYFVVTIKDAWGGRNFDAGFSAEWH